MELSYWKSPFEVQDHQSYNIFFVLQDSVSVLITAPRKLHLAYGIGTIAYLGKRATRVKVKELEQTLTRMPGKACIGYEKLFYAYLNEDVSVNAQGGEYGNALQVASRKEHEMVVHILLERGANVDAQGGRQGNALYAASEQGDEKVVQMLLDKGADVNAQGGEHGNALKAASERGDTRRWCRYC